jgi:transforming growth factor-beta-induced protein
MNLRRWMLLAGASLFTIISSTLADEPTCHQSQRTRAVSHRTSEAKANLLETAARTGQFRTLTTAILAANLDSALQGSGPFTVFAPSDAAFRKLPAGTLESLLQPENKEKLQAILKYHVIPGKVLAKDAARLTSAKTLLKETIQISDRHPLQINQAKVIQADILCNNGVIHVIDSVLLPPESAATSFRSDGILGVAQKAGKFKTLLTALKATGLDSALDSDGPFTVFAPTDDAFARLPAATLKKLLTSEGKTDLANILKYHVLTGKNLSARDAVAAGRATTLNGKRVQIDIKDGQLKINDASAVATDIQVSNGTIHVIDRVLMPN